MASAGLFFPPTHPRSTAPASRCTTAPKGVQGEALVGNGQIEPRGHQGCSSHDQHSPGHPDEGVDQARDKNPRAIGKNDVDTAPCHIEEKG